MSTITNDKQLRETLDGLSLPQQRQVAAALIGNVLSLTQDERVARAVKTAAEGIEDEDSLNAAFRAAKAAALEAHARCGADGEWTDQAGYFVARAAESAVAQQKRSHGKGPAWQAALSCRMARTARASENEDDAPESESAAQYRIVNEFLTR